MITAAFIGYKVDGPIGAALATVAIFAPSFAMTLLFSNVLGQVRHHRQVQGALHGVLVGFAGLLAVVTLQLGRLSLVGPVELILAGAAFVGVRYFQLTPARIFAIGLPAWFVLSTLGWT